VASHHFLAVLKQHLAGDEHFHGGGSPGRHGFPARVQYARLARLEFTLQRVRCQFLELIGFHVSWKNR